MTFNRKGLLRECLHSLLRQTRRPDAILVVDNASTDGTAELLAAEFTDITVLQLTENLGGAAGFQAGMRRAHRNGFDWLWVMDDDIEAHPDALETMLRYGNVSEFIHSRKETPEGEWHWEGMWDLARADKRAYSPADPGFRNGREWIPVNYGCFEGALIHRRVVDKIGFPDARFFVGDDDLIYGYMASLHTNVIYIRAECFRRKLPLDGGAIDRKLYLHFRNRFLVYDYLEEAGVPMSRAAFWLNSALRMAWQVRNGRGAPVLKSVRAMVAGMRDGSRGRYGPPPWIKRVPHPVPTLVVATK